MHDTIHQVNLLADSLRELGRRRCALRATLGALGLLVASNLALLTTLSVWNSQLRASSRLVAGRLSALRAQNDSMESESRSLDRQGAASRAARAVHASNRSWRQVTLRVADLLPPDVWIVGLTSTTTDEGAPALSIEGAALTPQAASRFVERLGGLADGTPTLTSLRDNSSGDGRMVFFTCWFRIREPAAETHDG